MYCVGLLFAITLDTATEIALLGIAAVQGSQGVSIWIILCLPLLFTCGMALTDSIDGIAMLGVYSWSMMAPLRKLYFTLIISLVSVLLAFSIAVLEILSLVAPDPGTGGPFWDGVTAATNADNFVIIGGFVVVTFLGSWAIAAGIYSCMTRIRKKSHSLKA